MSDSELALLVQEWEYHLRAKNLSQATIDSYLEAAARLDAFLIDMGVIDLDGVDQRALEKFVMAQGELVSSGTVLTRFRGLRVLFNWMVDSKEIERSPMARMKEPKGEQKPPDAPADEDVRRLLKSRSGRSFDERRAHAMLRFMFDTGNRVGEVVSLRTAGVGLAYGKGRKARVAPFGAKTAGAILAYQRERRKHRCAEVDQLFIGQRGPLSYNSAYRIVRGRGEAMASRYIRTRRAIGSPPSGSATAGTKATSARSAVGSPRTSCDGTERPPQRNESGRRTVPEAREIAHDSLTNREYVICPRVKDLRLDR